jgi:hypothetical protein
MLDSENDPPKIVPATEFNRFVPADADANISGTAIATAEPDTPFFSAMLDTVAMKFST